MPINIVGGAIDPEIEGVDVYLDDPTPAKASPACRIAERYVELVQAGKYDQIANLFHPDAVFLHTLFPKPRVGRKEIAEFYENAIAPTKPDIIAVGYTGEGQDCFVELATRVSVKGRSRYVLAAVDHFRVNANGEVVFMMCFPRSMPSE